MRLLLLSASAGNGHVAAARAVEAVLREDHPTVAVRHVDLFDHVSHTIALLGRRGYDACVNHTPDLWRALYERADGTRPVDLPNAASRLVRRFLGLVARWRPDRILTTYWASGILKSWVDAAVGRPVPVSVVITDAVLHRYWFHPSIDRYYVTDASIRDLLADRGFPPERVSPTGIPVHPRFRPGDRREARLALGLDPNRTWIVVAAGPRSMREMAHGANDVLKRFPGAGVVVLTARDGALRDRLARRADRWNGRLRVGGLVPDLDRDLVASDLLVSKGGGLITSEAMAVGVPVLVHRPIPGQEEANARRLSQAGAAHIVEDLDDLLRRLADVLGNSSRLADMRDAARRTGRPDAAREIAAAEVRRLDPA